MPAVYGLRYEHVWVGPCSAGYMAALDSSGANVLYSTYLNGLTDGAGLSLALDGQGNTYDWLSSSVRDAGARLR